jgi:hypothetical protein
MRVRYSTFQYVSHCMCMAPFCGLVMQFEWLNNITWRILAGSILENLYLQVWAECEDNTKMYVRIRQVHRYLLDFKCGQCKLVCRRWLELTACIITVFWDVTSCRLADNYQHFGETHCLLLQSMVRPLHPLSPFHKKNCCPLSLLYLNSTSWHCDTENTKVI